MLKIKKTQYMLATVILTTSSISMAKEISYNYIQGAYISSTVDTDTTAGDLDSNGVILSGSFSVSSAIAITTGYTTASFDKFFGLDIDTTILAFGVTAHASISPNADIFGNFSVLSGNIELSDGFNSLDDDDTGNRFGVGLRYSASNNTELELEFSRTDIFDEANNSFSAGVIFYTSNKFSLGASYATSDDSDSLFLKARFDIK